MGRRSSGATSVSPADFDKIVAKIGAVRRNACDKEVHRCMVCGHDGGKDEVAKLDKICGVSAWACVNLEKCRNYLLLKRRD